MYVEFLILNRDFQDEIVVIQVGKTVRENTIKVNTPEVARYRYKPGDRVTVTVKSNGQVILDEQL
jgi:hypothetical protein